jgi:hypothetical protein
VQGICARDKFPYFDRLWTDYIQEETRLVSRDDMVKSSSDENQSPSTRTRKGIRSSPDKRGMLGRRAFPEREASPEPRQKDLSKIRCFECHDFGTLFHSVHNGGKEEEGNGHQQKRLIKLRICSIGCYCCSLGSNIQI